MYTYIYIYIYIYRILLNKSVLYTVAIYTTVSDGQIRPRTIILHILQLYTEKRGRDGERGRTRRDPSERSYRHATLSLPPLPRYIHLRDVRRRRFAVRKPRTASNTVLRR